MALHHCIVEGTNVLQLLIHMANSLNSSKNPKAKKRAFWCGPKSRSRGPKSSIMGAHIISLLTKKKKNLISLLLLVSDVAPCEWLNFTAKPTDIASALIQVGPTPRMGFIIVCLLFAHYLLRTRKLPFYVSKRVGAGVEPIWDLLIGCSVTQHC